MKIRNIEFNTKYPVFLAPMEDVSDKIFRLMCRNFGADLVYSEFVSADAIIRRINRSYNKMIINSAERPCAVQIYGKDVDTMVEAAKICEEVQPDIIDLNFGCPVKKIACKGAGSGMLREPEKLLKITEAVVKAVKTPVTVKTRLGWDHDSIIIPELARNLQDCGIQALTIHGRTRSDIYTGTANWDVIKQVKDDPYMTIPIIGNGDITSPETCLNKFKESGVDAVMIGRASFGRPWIFAEIKHYLETGEDMSQKEFLGDKDTKFSQLWKVDILKQHALQCVEMIDELRGIMHFRKHLANTPVFKGIPDFKPTRIAMLKATTLKQLFEIMDNIDFNKHKEI